MNTRRHRQSLAVLATAAVAALGAAMLAAQTPKTEIVQLERVLIVGKRAEVPVIAQLPRVVITGRSTAAGHTQLAAAGTTPAL